LAIVIDQLPDDVPFLRSVLVYDTEIGSGVGSLPMYSEPLAEICEVVTLIWSTDETLTSCRVRLLPRPIDARDVPAETVVPKNAAFACAPAMGFACAPAMGMSRSTLAIRRVRRRAKGDLGR